MFQDVSSQIERLYHFSSEKINHFLSLHSLQTLIKLSDSEKPDLFMLFSQRRTSKLTIFVLQTYTTLREIK